MTIPVPKKGGNVPFLPHPLEAEVTQMNREPLSHPPDYLNIQSLSAQKTKDLSHGATNWRRYSVRTGFTQLGNDGSVIDKFMMRFWKSKHSAQKSRDDERFKRPSRRGRGSILWERNDWFERVSRKKLAEFQKETRTFFAIDLVKVDDVENKAAKIPSVEGAW